MKLGSRDSTSQHMFESRTKREKRLRSRRFDAVSEGIVERHESTVHAFRRLYFILLKCRYRYLNL